MRTARFLCCVLTGEFPAQRPELAFERAMDLPQRNLTQGQGQGQLRSLDRLYRSETVDNPTDALLAALLPKDLFGGVLGGDDAAVFRSLTLRRRPGRPAFWRSVSRPRRNLDGYRRTLACLHDSEFSECHFRCKLLCTLNLDVSRSSFFVIVAASSAISSRTSGER